MFQSMNFQLGVPQIGKEWVKTLDLGDLGGGGMTLFESSRMYF